MKGKSGYPKMNKTKICLQQIYPKIMAKKLSKQNGNGNKRDLGMSGRKNKKE